MYTPLLPCPAGQQSDNLQSGWLTEPCYFSFALSVSMNHSAGSEQRKERSYYSNDTSRSVLLLLFLSPKEKTGEHTVDTSRSNCMTKAQDEMEYYGNNLFSQTWTLCTYAENLHLVFIFSLSLSTCFTSLCVIMVVVLDTNLCTTLEDLKSSIIFTSDYACTKKALYPYLVVLLFVSSHENSELLNINFLRVIKHVRQTEYVGQLHQQHSLNSH